MPHPTTLPPENNQRPGRGWAALVLPVILGAVALGLALVARFLWIEPSTMGLACAPVPPPWWCSPRTGVILVHQFNGWGLVALVSGLLALVLRWYPMALLGLASGLVGLVLYNAGLAAVGLLAAVLLIIRR